MFVDVKASYRHTVSVMNHLPAQEIKDFHPFYPGTERTDDAGGCSLEEAPPSYKECVRCVHFIST